MKRPVIGLTHKMHRQTNTSSFGSVIAHQITNQGYPVAVPKHIGLKLTVTNE